MKAADLGRANSIIAALAALAKNEANLAKGITSSGIRTAGDNQWINFPVGMHDRLANMMREHIAAERARLGRLAAQISLTLP